MELEGPELGGLHVPQPEQQQDGGLQPAVDDDLTGVVDLGDPCLAPVEQVDSLGHDAERVGVSRAQLAHAGPQLFDLGRQVGHRPRLSGRAVAP